MSRDDRASSFCNAIHVQPLVAFIAGGGLWHILFTRLDDVDADESTEPWRCIECQGSGLIRELPAAAPLCTVGRAFAWQAGLLMKPHGGHFERKSAALGACLTETRGTCAPSIWA